MPEPGGWTQRVSDFMAGVPILGAISQDLTNRFGDTFAGKVIAGVMATVIGVSLLSVPWAAYRLYWLTAEIEQLSARVDAVATDVRGMAADAERRSRRNRERIRENSQNILEVRRQMLSNKFRNNGKGGDS